MPLRAGIAAGLAVAAATAFSLGSPLYAVVSAVIVTDLEAAQTRKLAVPRMLGTSIGALVGSLATIWMQPRPLAVGLGVLLPMFICQLLGHPAAAKVAGYVSGIIILSFSTDRWLHARDRLVETVVGIAAAAVVSLIPALYRPTRKQPPG